MEVVLKQFKDSLSENAPTEKEKFLANLMISNIGRPYYNDSASPLPTMLDCTYKWKDVKMWQDLMERFGENVGAQSENGLARAFRVFEFNQIRPTYVIRLRLSLLANLVNIQASKKYYTQNASLRSGLHLSMRFVRLHQNPTRMLLKNGARGRLGPLRAAQVARKWQERRGNERKFFQSGKYTRNISYWFLLYALFVLISLRSNHFLYKESMTR